MRAHSQEMGSGEGMRREWGVFIILSRVKDGVKVMNVAERAEISVMAILKKKESYLLVILLISFTLL